MWGRWFCQERLAVRPGARYRLCGAIKTKDVQHGVPSLRLSFHRGDKRLGGMETRNVYDARWTSVEAEGVAPPESEWAQVTCEASGLEGMAWFDALEVLELPQSGVWLSGMTASGSPHGLAPGDKLTATAALRNPLASARDLDLRWRLTDVEGRLVWQHAAGLRLTDAAQVRVDAGLQTQLGYLRLGLEVAENGTLLASGACDVPVLPALPTKPLAYTPFSVIAANQYSLVKGALTGDEGTWRRFARMMRSAGVCELRVWNHWTDKVNPKPGRITFEPGIYDLVCRVAKEEGIRVSMVFWMVPQWARGPEEDWLCHQLMQSAARYYARVGVDRFEIDNEPVGSQRYFDRLKAGYVGVKHGNPAAEALMAGFYWCHRRPNEFLLLKVNYV
jgi:hypothetical protein